MGFTLQASKHDTTGVEYRDPGFVQFGFAETTWTA
jgi:hypothetical protein